MIIPIRSATLPATAELLREEIEAGLRGLDLVPRSVSLDAPAWPAVAEFRLDLTGASAAEPGSFPRVESPGEGSILVARLQLAGDPVTVSGLPLSVDLQARGATLQMTRLSGDRHALMLREATGGTLAIATKRADLERLAHTLLAGLARKHGADLVQTHLAFTPRGARGLSFQAEVTAKVMMMKAPIAVTGDLDLSDDLQLSISTLRLTGSGMAANLARGFLQPQFDKLQQNPISLAALALGDLRLRDVTIAVDGETLRINATFGN